jgi:hypothetical protein
VFAIDPVELRKISVISLILANIWPLVGVLFLKWSVYPVIVLFWMESFVITLITLIKIALVPVSKAIRLAEKIALVPYFTFSYGLFFGFEMIAIYYVFSGVSLQNPDFPGPGTLYQSVQQYQLQWALLALTVSHGISFFTNYLKKKEYKKHTFNYLMWEPYERASVIMILVFIGGFLVKESGSIIALVILILIKIYADILAHIDFHKKIGDRPFLQQEREYLVDNKTQ